MSIDIVGQVGCSKNNCCNSIPIKHSYKSGVFKVNADTISFSGRGILPVNYRKATIEDIPAILKLEKQCFPEYERFYANCTNFLKKSIKTDLSHMIIQDEKGDIVGHFHTQFYERGFFHKFIYGFHTKSSEGTLLNKAVEFVYKNMPRKQKNLWLHSIAVNPEARGQKIGHQMMLAIFEQAASIKAKKIGLTVEENNEAAQKLYKKFGFETKQKVDNFFGEGKHAYLMEADLTNTESPERLEKLKREVK